MRPLRIDEHGETFVEAERGVGRCILLLEPRRAHAVEAQCFEFVDRRFVEHVLLFLPFSGKSRGHARFRGGAAVARCRVAP